MRQLFFITINKCLRIKESLMRRKLIMKENIKKFVGMILAYNTIYVFDGSVLRPCVFSTHSTLNSDYTRLSTLTNPPSDDFNKDILGNKICDGVDYDEAITILESLLNQLVYEVNTNMELPEGLVAEIGSSTSTELELEILEIIQSYNISICEDFQTLLKSLKEYSSFQLTINFVKDNEIVNDEVYYGTMPELGEVLSMLTPDSYRGLHFRNRTTDVDKMLILSYLNSTCSRNAISKLVINLINNEPTFIDTATFESSDGKYMITMELVVNPLETLQKTYKPTKPVSITSMFTNGNTKE